MNDQTLDIIRRAIARGMDNAAIRDFLDLAGVMADSEPAAPARTSGGRKVARNVVSHPAAAAKLNGRNFVKPDMTRTVYMLSKAANTPAKLDKLGITGNQRIVADFVGKHPNGADSREMRAAILRHKLRDDGTNKAIESAVHALCTREPAVLDRYERENGTDD